MSSVRLRSGSLCGLLAALLVATACSSGGAEPSSKDLGNVTANSVAEVAESSSDRPSGDKQAQVASKTSSSEVPGDWQGRYSYEFSDGPNAAGTAVTVTYELTLAPSTCRMTADGYQTDETILCYAKPIANGIDIRFKSYGDGRLTDKYDNQVYSVGDPLFSLERRGDEVLTQWKGYPLPDDKPHPKGVYFKR